MDLLDIVIVILLIAAGAAGYRRGISWVSFSMLGLLIGLVVGTAVARWAAARVAEGNYGNKGLIGFGVFASVVLVIQGIGTAIGFRARSATLARRDARLTEIDSVAGAGLGVIGTMFAAWFLGIVFGGAPAISPQIRNSFIESALARIDSGVPSFLAPLRQILQGTEFPIVFGNNFGIGPPQVQLPATIDTPGIRAAALSTVRVIAFSCGVEAGSAWPIAPGYFVTNAHVVAGSQRVVLQQQGVEGDNSATVVMYDPSTDLAVLHAPELSLPALQVAPADPPSGDTGAVIGYPGGGERTEVPAAVRGTELARGADIYANADVTRDIEVLNALVQPGNSGGPLVDRNGTVIGLVFAVSTTDSTEGYALAISQFRAEAEGAVGRDAGVSTQGCVD